MEIKIQIPDDMVQRVKTGAPQKKKQKHFLH